MSRPTSRPYIQTLHPDPTSGPCIKSPCVFVHNLPFSFGSSEFDQELDSLLVGPIPVGVNKFVFEADPPNVSKLPASEILGVTVILLSCAYDGREFVRVGYYVSHEYDTPELQAEPPKQHQLDRIIRNMLTDKPRVTRFAIKWYVCLRGRLFNFALISNLRDSEDSAPAEFPPEQPGADDAEDDADQYGAEEAASLEAEGEVEGGEEGEDVEMGGAEETAGPVKVDEGAESEDLEAESSGESDEEGEGEDEAEEDVEMEMGDAAPVAPAGPGAAPSHPPGPA